MNIGDEPVSTVRTWTTSAAKVIKSNYRLDSSSFLQLITGPQHIQMQDLSEIADVYQATVFGKRQMQSVFGKGIPLYAGSEIAMIDPEPSHYLREEFRSDIQRKLFVEPNTILMTLSGTVGTVALTSSRFLNVALSDDVMRIKCKDPNDVGFLYVFLSSPNCQQRLKSLAYGAVIQHLKYHQIEQLPVPMVSTETKKKLNEQILQVIKLREAAYELLSDSQKMLLKSTYLEPIESIHIKMSSYETFNISSSRVSTDPSGTSEYRLDANYYNPEAEIAIKKLKQCRFQLRLLKDMSERVFFLNRFTRTFVDKKYGVPYLAGKEIVQVRPTNMAYLSEKQTENIEQYRLKSGWLLMTCSGTIGRICLVWRNYENYVATHDLIRVVPKTPQFDGGYLYAFLSSEYGKLQVMRYKHGSVVDHITSEQVERVLIPDIPKPEQEIIGDIVRQAYEKRAEAIRLEDDAQALLMNELTDIGEVQGV